MTKARWILRAAAEPTQVARLEQELKLPAALCRLLVVRGLSDPEAAKRWLRPRLDQLHEPGALVSMDRAVARLVHALDAGETILVHGDYDVDGMCATTLLVSVLRALGGTAVPFIPHRLTDGYDLGDAGVQAAREAKAGLVVTCDCGTSAHRAIDALRASGIDVIVSDHHLPGGPLPECVAVLNPKRPDAETGDRDLVAVGVAFHLARALVAERGADERHALRHLDLVALATVADVGALRGENRALVREGLRFLTQTTRPGLRALIRSSGLEGKALTAGRVGFTLAPRLNAAGRLGSALRGVELLLADNDDTANRIARELEELNRTRQAMDRDTLDAARDQVAQRGLDDAWGLVLAGDGWHPGVVGIVASRIVEEFGRPAVLVAMDGDTGKGSGRSIGAFDLHAGLGECRDLLLRFGGHRVAAGVTVERRHVPAFADRFNAVAKRELTPDDLVPELRADLELPLRDVTDDLERLLRHGEPWGVANPTPVFVARGLTVAERPRVMKGEHLRLRVADGATALDAIGWRLAERGAGLAAGDRVDVAFQVERDTWGGRDVLQLKLADVRASG